MNRDSRRLTPGSARRDPAAVSGGIGAAAREDIAGTASGELARRWCMNVTLSPTRTLTDNIIGIPGGTLDDDLRMLAPPSSTSGCPPSIRMATRTRPLTPRDGLEIADAVLQKPVIPAVLRETLERLSP